MNLDLIRSFFAIVEHGSLNKAALRLRVSQSTLTRQMHALEHAVGGRLLERGAAGVALTAAGHTLHASMKPVLADFEVALAAARRQASGKSSQVRIGYLLSAAPDYLNAALASLRRLHPDVKVKLLDLSPGEQVAALRRGELDLAVIGHFGAFLVKEFFARSIASLPLVAALPANHPLAGAASVRLEDLNRDLFIGAPEKDVPGYNRWVTQLCRRAGFRPRFVEDAESHAELHETGGSGANAGIQFTSLGEKGAFTPEEFLAAIKPRGHIIYPPTTLVEIENTHNRAGGIIFPQDYAEKICAVAKKHSISSYLDGARIWNAAVAVNKPVSHLAGPFDLVSVSLSKGLGAPGGSLLAGKKDLITQCTRYRRMLGGAMRQVGIFAAAGMYALDHNLERLSEDHYNARLIAERLSTSEKIILDPEKVQTNIIVFSLTDDAPDAATIVEKARQNGVLIFAFGNKTIRAVTHLHVTKTQCEFAADVLLRLISS